MHVTQCGDQVDLEISWPVFSVTTGCMTLSQLLYPQHPSVQRDKDNTTYSIRLVCVGSYL